MKSAIKTWWAEKWATEKWATEKCGQYFTEIKDTIIALKPIKCITSFYYVVLKRYSMLNIAYGNV